MRGTPTDPAFASARQLASLIRRRRIGCVELLEHFLDRVRRFDGALNAIVVLDEDRARGRARALDRKRVPVGPLHGVPITVKESFDVAGLATTWGHEHRRDHVAEADALPVQRLAAAGAVVFGKTNVPVALADWQSYNPLYGTTSNPWDHGRTPGGSSGGSAAALAAGLTGLELGSDIGGSIRVPAHYCGVYGLKPSWGLLPSRGQSITGNVAPSDVSVIGPLARSADDLVLALDLLARPDPEETALRVVLPPAGAERLAGLRVAVWDSEPGQHTDPDTIAALRALATWLRRQGARVSLTARPGFDPIEAFHTYLRLLQAVMSARADASFLEEAREAAARLAPDDMSADAVLTRAVAPSYSEWLGINETRHRLRRVWAAFFRDWDVLLCPVISTPAMPHMQEGRPWERRVPVGEGEITYNEMLFWPGIVGGFYLPAAVAPLGETSAGLPLGVQIVGPPHGDRRTIQVARLLERGWRGFEAPPGYA